LWGSSNENWNGFQRRCAFGRRSNPAHVAALALVGWYLAFWYKGSMKHSRKFTAAGPRKHPSNSGLPPRGTRASWFRETLPEEFLPPRLTSISMEELAAMSSIPPALSDSPTLESLTAVPDNPLHVKP
jgi:hypothetical protein